MVTELLWSEAGKAPWWPPEESTQCQEVSKGLEEHRTPVSQKNVDGKTFVITNLGCSLFYIVHAFNTSWSLFCTLSQ